MSERPSHLWRDMPLEKRVIAAVAFWRDAESPDIAAQHAEAIGMLARRMKFRVRSVQTLPIPRRARFLAQCADVSDAIATRALIAYHFEAQRPLMGAFLDALGVEHEDGLIAADDLPPPDRDRLAAAVEVVRTAYPPEDVNLYLKTLLVLDADTWSSIEDLMQAGEPSEA